MSQIIDDYAFFKRKVKELLGIDLDGYKDEQIKRRVGVIMSKAGVKDFVSFYKAIESNLQLRKEFIDKVTINVSEFFRNPEQFDILRNKVIPRLIDKFGSIKIWSAGCSYGNEPYSVAMILDELKIKNFTLLATDIDELALQRAREGIYKAEELKGLSQERISKYFMKVDVDKYKIVDNIRLSVKFSRLDLLRDSYPRGMHLILCRNVIIYFTQEAKELVFKNISESLIVGGVLFLGNTERIFNPERFKLKSIDLFFYEKVM